MTDTLKNLTPTSDTAVGWTRTTVQSVVTALIVWAASNVFDITVDTADPWIILVAGAFTAVVWRTSMYVAARWPIVGYFLFLVNKAPGYQDSPPANPAVQADPPGE